MTWRPMDTAPRDGTKVLLMARAAIGGNSLMPVVGYCDARANEWRDSILPSGINRAEVVIYPERWMEIPPE